MTKLKRGFYDSRIDGGIGTGKSTVSRKLRERGYPVIDLDVISREVIEYPEVIDELVRNFGIEILESQNNISGKKSISRNSSARLSAFDSPSQ